MAQPGTLKITDDEFTQAGSNLGSAATNLGYAAKKYVAALDYLKTYLKGDTAKAIAAVADKARPLAQQYTDACAHYYTDASAFITKIDQDDSYIF
jgi:hypothetical protein